jgi:large subunit ribosomal protein L14
MIQQETILTCADNTGAKTLHAFHNVGGSWRRATGIGDIIVCSVRNCQTDGQVKSGDVVKAVIVRTTFPKQRKDGTVIRFDDNAAVIIDKEGNPKGTRIFGPVARELREKGYMKIVSLAPEVL